MKNAQFPLLENVPFWGQNGDKIRGQITNNIRTCVCKNMLYYDIAEEKTKNDLSPVFPVLSPKMVEHLFGKCLLIRTSVL